MTKFSDVFDKDDDLNPSVYGSCRRCGKPAKQARKSRGGRCFVCINMNDEQATETKKAKDKLRKIF